MIRREVPDGRRQGSTLAEWRAYGRLWARLPRFGRLLVRTDERIKLFLSRYLKPAVAYSFGKDSGVLLHRVRQHDETVPAIYVDQGAEVPDTTAFRAAFPVTFFGPVDTVLADLSYEDASEQYSWWGASPITGPDIATAKWKRLTLSDPLARWYAARGVDGCFDGIRGEESPGRTELAKAVYGRDGIDTRTKPPRCHPLIDWSARDVWAYHAAHDLPYNPVYDRELLGFDRYSIRVAAVLCDGGHLSHGVVSWLRTCYPEWFNQMRLKYPHWGALGG